MNGLGELLEAYFRKIARCILWILSSSKREASDMLLDNTKYKYAILVIIISTGAILWFFRILILFGLFHNVHGGGSWFVDFREYYNAADLYLSGESAYINTGFYYLPLTLVMFLPLSYTSFDEACLLFSVFNIALLISTIVIISKILHFYNIRLSSFQMLLLFLTVFLTYPISTSFTHGQVNILILFLISFFYYNLFVRNRLNLASFLLSIASVVKIWPSVLVLLSFITKNARGLLSRYCLIIGALCVISLTLFGISMHLEFLDKIIGFQDVNIERGYEVRNPTDALDPNASVFNSITKILSIMGLTDYDCLKILFGIKLIFISCLLYFLYRSSEDLTEQESDILMFSSLIIMVLVASNKTWLYYATFLVLSYILLIFVLDLNILERLILIVSIALFSTQEYVVFLSNILGGSALSAVYITSPTMWGYMLFLILVIHIILRKKSEGTDHQPVVD